MGENKGRDTKEEEGMEEDKGNKTQIEDSGQEADEDNYTDYLDLDYIC